MSYAVNLKCKNQITIAMRKTSRNLIIFILIIISGIGIFYLSAIVFSSKKELQAIDNGAGVLKVRLKIGQEDSTYSLRVSDQLDLTLITIKDRLDKAGFNTDLESQSDGSYSLALDNVSDTALAKRLITSNINIGLWETVNSSLYKKITDTTNAQIKPLLGVFSLYEYDDNSCVWGSALLEDTAIVNQIIRNNIIDTLFDNVVLLWGKSSYCDSIYDLYTLSPAIDGGPSILINDYIEDVEIIENPDYPGIYSLDITLNTEGAHLWSMFTRNNVSENIAFAASDMVFMSQLVDAENASGKLEIDSRWSETEAMYTKAILLSGNLQMPVQIVDEQFTSMSDKKNNVKTNLMLAGISVLILLALFISLFYILLHNKNHTKKEDKTRNDEAVPDTHIKSGRILYRVLCALFIVFSIVLIVKALTDSVMNLSDLVQGITLTIISLAFCMKKRFSWFYMLAFWLLLISVALVTLCVDNSLLGLFILLIFISIPIIIAILSKQVKYAQFGITDKKSVLIKNLIIPIIILAAVLLLLPKLIFLLLS